MSKIKAFKCTLYKESIPQDSKTSSFTSLIPFKEFYALDRHCLNEVIDEYLSEYNRILISLIDVVTPKDLSY